MRKILALIFVVALLLSWATVGMAESYPQEYTLKVTLTNTATNTSLFTVIPITPATPGDFHITPGKHRIIKFTVSNIAQSGGTEVIAALYDATTVGGAGNAQIEGEIESDDQDSIAFKYDRPLDVANGIVASQGAQTSLTIEYVRFRP